MIFAAVPVLQRPDEMLDTWYTWTGCGPELLIVDNTANREWEWVAENHGWSYITFGQNLGVPAAWNIARAKFLADTDRDEDLLLLFSASVRWDDGLANALDQFAAAANWKGCQSQFGFHALAWSRKVFELEGDFDEVFDVGYDGDCDWAYRLILAGILVPDCEPVPQIEIRGDCTDARAVLSTGLVTQTRAGRMYYCAKWGSDPSSETFTTPFDSGLPRSWWSPIYRPGKQHLNLGERTYRR